MRHAFTWILSLLLLAQLPVKAQVKIGDNPTTIDASSLLELESTGKGLLPPRMTTANRTAIGSPATGLVVFDTDKSAYYYYNGTRWVELTDNANGLRDTDADTKIQVEESTDEDKIRFDTKGSERMIIDDAGLVGIGTSSPVSTLDLQGSLGMKISSISSATTLDATYGIVQASDASGSFTITLPAAASNSGRMYYIKKTNSSSNTITIDGNGAETIDGATTLVLYVQYDAVRIVCNGSSWYVVDDQIHPHTCRLRRAAAQSISDNTYTDISFDTEDYDIGGIGDITTDHRIEIRRDGYYQITGAWTTNAVMDDNEQLAAYIAVNGTTYVRGMEIRW